MEFYEELAEECDKKNINDVRSFLLLRDSLVKKYKLNHAPSLQRIMASIQTKDFEKFKFLQSKPVRTISGVAPLAIMTKPYPCSHGKCTFCPGGVDSYFGDVPQSYTGNEPASMRAKRNKYDAYLQVFNRLEQYILLGRIPEKIELIIMGGTFPSYPISYQDEFICYALKAMNDFSDLFLRDEFDFALFKEMFDLPHDINNRIVREKIIGRLLDLKGNSDLVKEQLRNETSRIRCVTFCIETKPDCCFYDNINQILKLGVTRVEIGVQTLNNKILRLVNRGHSAEDTIKATQLLKDSFLKCVYHMMPGLPESSKEEDINNFREIFSNNDFKPDGLKIYPCMVMHGTSLFEQYKRNEFMPLTTEEAADIVIKAKEYIPKYCRVLRVQRDIPTKVTVDGVDITNFRQYIHNIMRERNLKCKCIRCREPKDREIYWDDVKLNRLDYEASNGKEIFLSFDEMKNDILLGFVRLRIPYKPFRPEITERSAGIREVHVYGNATALSKEGEIQHKGIGKKLMLEAERIAKEEYDVKKLLVISGVGVREYYKNNFTYVKDGVYMSKEL